MFALVKDPARGVVLGQSDFPLLDTCFRCEGQGDFLDLSQNRKNQTRELSLLPTALLNVVKMWIWPWTICFFHFRTYLSRPLGIVADWLRLCYRAVPID